MRVLVVCQHYFPEPFRITDICEELVSHGHEVTVLTGVPNYPEGVVYEGYKYGKKRDEIINGVKVHRCFTIARKKGILFRLLNYYSFSFSSAIRALRMKEKFDVVFVNQLSPVMMARAAKVYKKKHGTRLVLYCLDLWPESLIAGGIKKDSLIYKIFHVISKRFYSSADRIMISSKSFSSYFDRKFGIKETLYLPQYAEALFDAEACKKEQNDTVDLMFAGNVGKAQSIQTIIEAADKTRDIANLRWHIVGYGSEYERMTAMAQSMGLENVIFHGRHPLEEMPKYYSMADAMLMTMQKDEVISLTLPGKMQTYMAAGKPILGAIDGEAATIIRDSECGLCCSAEDADGLANIARSFVDTIRTQNYGECSLRFYKEHFTKTQVIDRLIQVLKDEA